MDPRFVCVFCPRLCHHVCPTIRSEGRETTSPTSLLTLLYFKEKDPSAPPQEILSALDHCILCGRCTAICELSATPWEAIREARSKVRTDLGLSPSFSREELWGPPPVRHPVGRGLEPWLLIGSLTGIEVGSLLKHLSGDLHREWWFPRSGLPLQLYVSWALGYESIYEQYFYELRTEILDGGFRGIAWADPHEGRAVKDLIKRMGYRGKSGYAPVLLGLVERERFSCHDLRQRYGCCGAAGGYPLIDPEQARFLAENFPETSEAVPGVCRAHLSRWNRKNFSTDWR